MLCVRPRLTPGARGSAQVVALARGGVDIDAAHASACVFGYGVGIDFTRRDMQARRRTRAGGCRGRQCADACATQDEAKRTRRPWDMSKARALLLLGQRVPARSRQHAAARRHVIDERDV